MFGRDSEREQMHMRAPGVIKTTLCSLLVAIVGVPIAEPAVAQDAASATTIFHQLNDASIAIYQEAKRRFLSDADPVVIAGFSSILIRQHGAEKRVGQTPAPYDLLKTVDHVPRSLWAALSPAIAGLDREAAWRGGVPELRPPVAPAPGAAQKKGL